MKKACEKRIIIKKGLEKGKSSWGDGKLKEKGDEEEKARERERMKNWKKHSKKCSCEKREKIVLTKEGLTYTSNDHKGVIYINLSVTFIYIYVLNKTYFYYTMLF